MSVLKESKNERVKEKVQTCAQTDRRGERFPKTRKKKKNAGGCSTLSGRKTWDEGQETEGDCWRICVHFEP